MILAKCYMLWPSALCKKPGPTADAIVSAVGTAVRGLHYNKAAKRFGENGSVCEENAVR